MEGCWKDGSKEESKRNLQWLFTTNLIRSYQGLNPSALDKTSASNRLGSKGELFTLISFD
jgi:hypothetical protein